jgi:hypothetical protein
MTTSITIPATYRHCEGDLCTTVGAVTAKASAKEGMAVRTEFGVAICTTALEPGDSAIVYQAEAEDGQKYIRTSESFAEVLGNGTTHYYRFERVVD